jgi:uncharacterized membrane protein HdeD (DUF308 family)
MDQAKSISIFLWECCSNSLCCFSDLILHLAHLQSKESKIHSPVSYRNVIAEAPVIIRALLGSPSSLKKFWEKGVVIMQLFQNRPEDIARNWGWFLALGILLFILGGFAISATVSATLITVFTLGIVLLIAGLGQCIMAIREPQWSGFFLNLLAGLLAMVMGYLFVQSTGVSAVTLTLLMAAYFMVSGLFKVFTAATHRFHQWGWMLLNGIAGLILGALLWAQWPISGLWAIGLFVGIDLVMMGIFWGIVGISLRRLTSHGHPHGLAQF